MEGKKRWKNFCCCFCGPEAVKSKKKKEVFDAMRRFWVGKKRWKFVFFVLTTLFCFWLFLSGLSYNTSQPGTTKLKKKQIIKTNISGEKRKTFFFVKERKCQTTELFVSLVSGYVLFAENQKKMEKTSKQHCSGFDEISVSSDWFQFFVLTLKALIK